MGGACGTYGRQDRYIQGFRGETCGKETTWKREDNFKLDNQEVGLGEAWTGFIWLRIETGGGLL
jgi:hypothetical protein